MNITAQPALPPIFIGGMFKSGTSLLRAMIGNHTMVASGLETYWFQLDWQHLQANENRDRLRTIGEFYELNTESLQKMTEKCASAEAFLSRLMDYWATKNSKPRWAEKTPGNILHIDRINAFWPDASIVHIIRDPRDIFISLRDAGKWDSIDSFMSRWSAVFGSIERFRQNHLLERADYHEVRYEQLVSNPEEFMHALCQAIGLPFEPRIAVFDGQKGDFEKVKSVTGKESTTLARLAQPMTTERLGIWKSKLSSEEIEKLAAAANDFGLTREYERACI